MCSAVLTRVLQRRPDASKIGKACGEQAPKCNWLVCEDAECVVRIDPKLIGKSCVPDRGAPEVARASSDSMLRANVAQ